MCWKDASTKLNMKSTFRSVVKANGLLLYTEKSEFLELQVKEKGMKISNFKTCIDKTEKVEFNSISCFLMLSISKWESQRA